MNSKLIGFFMAASLLAVSQAQAIGPCKQIRLACESAGYYKGGHKKGAKGLWKDCIDQLKAGNSVAGVSVPPAQVAACEAKIAARKAQRAAAGQK